ncbi:Methionyl-tRNA formyltransferase [Diatrype stigma]|uniref:methionyl-tRNA formyltransferase n=1 Tax=Diatrype stigma TaxID=117547 RepID=A0AAN9UXL9_9PEZI
MLRHTSRIFRVRRPWTWRCTSCLTPPRSVLAPPILRNGRRTFTHFAYSGAGNSSNDGSSNEAADAVVPKKVPPLRRLRILFCGSDEFSAASLKALEEARRQDRANGGLIHSIDVVVRPGKRTGRGLQTVQEVPLKTVAESLGLPVHLLENDTFTGWKPPPEQNFNLIIAVSFGLFVPPRLLRAARYGGLNVHPSLLPAYRGPAPLHRQLLEGVETAGVSLQTLDEEAFDRGEILARRIIQWPVRRDRNSPPGISGGFTTRVPRDCTVPQLAAAAGAVGAQMLVEALRAELHVLEIRARAPPPPARMRASYAPKITPWDRQLPPTTWAKPRSLARRQRVVGPLWFKAKAFEPLHPSRGSGVAGAVKRILVDTMEEVDLEFVGQDAMRSSLKGRISSSRLPRKWVYRKINRIYSTPPRGFNVGRRDEEVKAEENFELKAKVEEGEPPATAATATAPAGAAAAPQQPIPLYYWTAADDVASDGAIYISPYNPPNMQKEAYVRIPTLKVEGEKAKPAAQIAAAFGDLAQLPPLAWQRSLRLQNQVDFYAHVAHELGELKAATSRLRLLDPDFVSSFTSSFSNTNTNTTTTTTTTTTTFNTTDTDTKTGNGHENNDDNDNDIDSNNKAVPEEKGEALRQACDQLDGLLEIRNRSLAFICRYWKTDLGEAEAEAKGQARHGRFARGAGGDLSSPEARRLRLESQLFEMSLENLKAELKQSKIARKELAWNIAMLRRRPPADAAAAGSRTDGEDSWSSPPAAGPTPVADVLKARDTKGPAAAKKKKKDKRKGKTGKRQDPDYDPAKPLQKWVW